MDPEVAAFLTRHHTSPREEVAAEVDPYRGKSPEETWPDVVAVCRAAARLLAANPERDRIVGEVDPPHPSYAAILRRLRSQAS